MSTFFEKLKKGMEIEKDQPTVGQPKAGKKEREIKIKKGKKELSGWPGLEGQLTVDVFETEKDIVIQSAIAGLKPEDLEVTIEDDVVLIKGSREKQFTEETKNYFHQECYWGKFSREIILPVEAESSKAKASIKNGILTIRIPKAKEIKTKKLVVEE